MEGRAVVEMVVVVVEAEVWCVVCVRAGR